MKVRFGVGARTTPDDLPELVERLESHRIDSLWFSEQVYSAGVDPFVGLAWALARTSHLKVGTSVAVLPGRHPVLVAKQIASLAALAPKRVLPVFGLRPAQPDEVNLFPVPAGQRGAVFDESMLLLRRLLTEPTVDFDGTFFSLVGARVQPLAERAPDLWLGGSAPAGLRRVGRLADGWLGSFLTPAEAGAARRSIEAAAAEAGRSIEPDHYGMSILLAEPGGIPERTLAALSARRPDVDPRDLVANGWPELHRLLDDFIEQGLTKFVIYGVDTPTADFVDRFAAELLPRQN